MQTEKVSVLFVDDEPHVLHALRRMTRSRREEWDTHFADSGQAALSLMHTQHIDVLVADMRMPEMDGAALLTAVMHEHPDTIRLILSGHSDQSLVIKAVAVAHQYLTKPWEPDSLLTAIQRSLVLRQTLQSETLRIAVGGVKTLPSLPKLYTALTELLQKPDVDMQAIADIVAQDISMSVKVLQMVNSSFFGLSRSINNIHQAVTFLGADTLKALVLSCEVFSSYQASAEAAGFSLEDLSTHSLVCAKLAKAVAVAAGANKKLADDCFIAGLLHDVGKLILLQDGAAFAKMKQKQNAGMDECEAETAVFGATHAEVGAHLLRVWGLPDGLVEAAAFHHGALPVESNEFTPVVAVKLANAMLDEPTGTQEGLLVGIEEKFLARYDLQNYLAAWRALRDELMETKA